MASERARPSGGFSAAAPSLVGEGGRIIYRKHWAVLLRSVTVPLFLTMGTALAWASVLASGLSGLIFGTVWLALPAVAASLAAPAWLLWRFDNWRNDLYVLTADRIIDIERLPLGFRIDAREAPLINVQNVALRIPNVLAASLNFGDVIIETAGRQGTMTFRSVPNPQRVLREISAQAEAVRARAAAWEESQRREELLDWFVTYGELERLKLVASPPQAQVGQKIAVEWRLSAQAKEVETQLRWDFFSRPHHDYACGTELQRGGSGNYRATLRVPLAERLFFAAWAQADDKSYWSGEAMLIVTDFGISYPSEATPGQPVLVRWRAGTALDGCTLVWWPLEKEAASRVVTAEQRDGEWQADFSPADSEDICFRLDAVYEGETLASSVFRIAWRQPWRGDSTEQDARRGVAC